MGELCKSVGDSPWHSEKVKVSLQLQLLLGKLPIDSSVRREGPWGLFDTQLRGVWGVWATGSQTHRHAHFCHNHTPAHTSMERADYCDMINPPNQGVGRFANGGYFCHRCMFAKDKIAKDFIKIKHSSLEIFTICGHNVYTWNYSSLFEWVCVYMCVYLCESFWNKYTMSMCLTSICSIPRYTHSFRGHLTCLVLALVHVSFSYTHT